MPNKVDYNKIKNQIEIYIPGRRFPSISITGDKCGLHCAHCDSYYLKQMLKVNSPNKLIEVCEKLHSQGALGVLISGGCDSTGHVKLEPYLKAIATIKKRTGLILNIHTGLINLDQATNLAQTGVDVVSIDVVGDDDTIKKVYGLSHPVSKYEESLKALNEAGIKKVVPHVCVGLDFGMIVGEFNSIDMIANINPSAIVFIVLVPTTGTRMVACKPPEIKRTIEVIEYAKVKCKDAKIYIGCMRPRSIQFRDYNNNLEKEAINTGVDGVVIPSKSTIVYVKNLGRKVVQYDTCCAV